MEPPAFDPEIDAATKMLNPRAIAECSIALADAIGPLLVGREVPVVLGGDCTILLGCTLAMDRTLERTGSTASWQTRRNSGVRSVWKTAAQR